MLTRDCLVLCVVFTYQSDLRQSLQSGRLYAQAEAMLRHYRQAVLLIEFAAEQRFYLEAESGLPTEISQSSLVSRLVLLALHFPRLRVLWSRSPHATVQMFRTLKQAVNAGPQQEPDPAAAAAVGRPDGADANDAGGANVALEMLRRMPGITPANVYKVANNVRDLAALGAMSLAQLQALLGASAAKQLFTFLSRDYRERNDGGQ